MQKALVEDQIHKGSSKVPRKICIMVRTCLREFQALLHQLLEFHSMCLSHPQALEQTGWEAGPTRGWAMGAASVGCGWTGAWDWTPGSRGLRLRAGQLVPGGPEPGSAGPSRPRLRCPALPSSLCGLVPALRWTARGVGCAGSEPTHCPAPGVASRHPGLTSGLLAWTAAGEQGVPTTVR